MFPYKNFFIILYNFLCSHSLSLSNLLIILNLKACSVATFSLFVLVTQLCLTLCDSVDCSPPDSSAHGFSRQEYWSG